MAKILDQLWDGRHNGGTEKFLAQGAHDDVLVLGSAEGAILTDARDPQGGLAVDAMLTGWNGESLWVIFRLHTDFVRQIHINTADGVHDGFEGQHVDCQVMIGPRPEIEVERARQQTGSSPGPS